MIEDLAAKIKKYMEKIAEGKSSPDNEVCPRCGREPVCFSLHERRARQFLWVVERLVKKVETCLLRWKCHECKKTFTEYPDFAQPHKRYMREQMIEKSLSYSVTPGLTYRKSWQVKGEEIYYDSGNDERIDDRQPSPSTLWNWVGCVGSWNDRLFKGMALLKEKSGESKIFREIIPVHFMKYRSEERKKLLEICSRLFSTGQEFGKVFLGKSIFFPDFCTGYP